MDHSTLCRWVQTYALQQEAVHRKRRPVCGSSWRMDETYIKVAGRWFYLYRAVDSHTGDTVDFLLTRHRDKKAALRFFKKAMAKHGVPSTVTIDKSGANTAALEALNAEQQEAGKAIINIRQNKYLNNRVEQGHRGIKKITKPMMGFKSISSAKKILAGIELCHVLRKGQYDQEQSANVWEYFYSLAG